MLSPTVTGSSASTLVTPRSAALSNMSSYEPISHAAPCGLGTPRWSVLGQPVLSPPLIAWLDGNRAWVKVSPPLSCRVPSRGSVLTISPLPVNPQVFVLSRLCPWELIAPEALEQLPPTPAPGTMVFFYRDRIAIVVNISTCISTTGRISIDRQVKHAHRSTVIHATAIFLRLSSG